MSLVGSIFMVEENGTIRDAANNVLFTQELDGTLLDASGKVIILSIERFVRDICLGNHCFICGVSPKDAPFNDEHIIPRWILDFTQQFRGNIGLPNQLEFRGYGNYTLPCCVRCNSGLSDEFESVLAPLFRGGYATLRAYMEKNGATIIFRWLALTYLKTHLRDARLRMTLDRRKGDESKIGDLYEWEGLHHVHCIARAHYSGIDFDSRQIGTLAVVPALAAPNNLPVFDYTDGYLGRTVMIRVGEVACFAVLNDASIVGNTCPRLHEVLTSAPPLNPFQIRELYAELAWRNLCLRTRPRFHTIPVPIRHFAVDLPAQLDFNPPAPEETYGQQESYGRVLRAVCADYFEGLPSEKRGEAEELVRKEQLTFFTTHVPRWPVVEDEAPESSAAVPEGSSEA